MSAGLDAAAKRGYTKAFDYHHNANIVHADQHQDAEAGPMIVETRALAWFGLAGTLCDALGGIYLTYDILGGRGGPLGFLSRAGTCILIMGLGCGLPFGPFFGGVAGFGLGTILALEFWRVARHQRVYHSSPLYNLPWFGAARGVVLGLAAVHPFGWKFGARFGLLSALGLFALYGARYAPTCDYDARMRPTFNRHILMAAFLRGLVISGAAALTGWIGRGTDYAVGFGLAIGATAGVVSVFTGLVSPCVEWWVENLPEKHLAVLGFALIGLGLLLQSVQSVTVLLG